MMKIIKPLQILKNNKESKILDLTSTDWQSDTKYYHLGSFKQYRRAYKKTVLLVSIIIASLSLILPDLGLGLIGGLKILRKWG